MWRSGGKPGETERSDPESVCKLAVEKKEEEELELEGIMEAYKSVLVQPGL